MRYWYVYYEKGFETFKSKTKATKRLLELKEQGIKASLLWEE